MGCKQTPPKIQAKKNLAHPSEAHTSFKFTPLFFYPAIRSERSKEILYTVDPFFLSSNETLLHACLLCKTCLQIH